MDYRIYLELFGATWDYLKLAEIMQNYASKASWSYYETLTVANDRSEQFQNHTQINLVLPGAEHKSLEICVRLVPMGPWSLPFSPPPLDLYRLGWMGWDGANARI